MLPVISPPAMAAETGAYVVVAPPKTVADSVTFAQPARLRLDASSAVRRDDRPSLSPVVQQISAAEDGFASRTETMMYAPSVSNFDPRSSPRSSEILFTALVPVLSLGIMLVPLMLKRLTRAVGFLLVSANHARKNGRLATMNCIPHTLSTTCIMFEEGSLRNQRQRPIYPSSTLVLKFVPFHNAHDRVH